MRVPAVLVLLLVLGGSGRAACPADCVPGGGPTATDCFVAWSGLDASAATCVDGTGCDRDGTADGVCTVGLEGCVNVPGLGDCTPGALSASPSVRSRSPAGRTLAAALGTLDRGQPGCTAAGIAVPVKVSLAGRKAGTVRLVVTAASGGKRDRDTLLLTCAPSAPPPFAAVQDVFTRRCATPSCHLGFSAAERLNLEAGRAYGATVNQPAAQKTRLAIVAPGSLRASYLARKLLGKGIAGARMPFDPTPLSPADLHTILAWIEHGAPPE
jgi:hypothetical protein